MKLTPEQQAVIDRMAPGALCRDGFLGKDTRPLMDIIAADKAAVDAIGTSCEELAGRLRLILKDALAGQGRDVQVSDNLKAVYSPAMGRIPSPWPGEGVFAKGEIELSDARAGSKLLFTPLSVHMIAEHGFFQGRFSRYRIEPEVLAGMLE